MQHRSIIAAIVAAGVLGIGAQQATADPPGSGSLEWRVSRLEADLNGAYANTSYLTQHIIALQKRDAELERRLAKLERRR